jgi:hypothetical protein
MEYSQTLIQELEMAAVNTFIGPVMLAADPVDPMEACTRNYVDAISGVYPWLDASRNFDFDGWIKLRKLADGFIAQITYKMWRTGAANFVNSAYLGTVPPDFTPKNDRVVIVSANEQGDGEHIIEIRRSNLAIHICQQDTGTTPWIYGDGIYALEGAFA